jgi:hypothetical protein
MTIRWKNAEDEKPDKGSVWIKAAARTDITEYIITYYLKSNPDVINTIVVDRAADLIDDEDELRCKSNDVAWVDDTTCPDEQEKRWPTQKSIEDEKVRNLLNLKYKITQNVIAGETYMVQVSARSRVGPSFATRPIEILAMCCPTAPTGLRSDSTLSQTENIGLLWQHSVSECSPLLRYEVMQKEVVNDGQRWISVNSPEPTQNKWTFKNAALCQDYSFAVISYNEKCRSPVSNLITVTNADKPRRPTMNTCAYNADTDEFSFSWSSAQTPSCAPITEYNL